MLPAAVVDRRDFLGLVSGLVVSFGTLPGGALAAEDDEKVEGGVDPKLLDSWIAVAADGSVLASVGKIEAGLGVSTAFAQIVAEELDVPMAKVRIRMGDTATTVDQRGTGSSNGIKDGGGALRKAAAEARMALLGMAAERLGVPANQLQVRDGIVSTNDTPPRTVSYGELLSGRRFDLRLSGKAPLKKPADYRVVGQPVPRVDIPLKVTARYDYLVDLRVPGMVHGRVIRPPTAGAQLLKVPAGQKFPGLVRVVHKGNFLAVVCQREEQAINAARLLKTTWSKPEPMFSANYDALYEHLRTAPGKGAKAKLNVGNVDQALASAPSVLDAVYEYPFQSHACMGPGCGVADVRKDRAELWMGGQKPYGLRKVLAEITGLPFAAVQVHWMPGPGSYGMNDADDAAIDAALLSREIGKPVRVQYMRHDGTAWDPKGPPTSIRLRGALAGDGSVAAFDYFSRGYSGRTRLSGTDAFADTLSAHLIGGYPGRGTDLYQYNDENYKFANKRVAGDLVPWEKSLPTGLRTAHLRDPDGMSTCFASESFVDELACAAKADAVAFRLRHLPESRDSAVIKAAAERANWQTRPSPNPDAGGKVVTGRGIAYAPRAGSVVAIVAEVEVDRSNGEVRVKRFVVGHDCGAVINPLSLQHVVESNMLMGLSRTLHEEVRFDAERVLSVDWNSYPILDITEAPDSIELVIVGNRPDAPNQGAGEPSTRPVAAAVANAIFDATGARVRRVPFTPERVLAALKSTGRSVTSAPLDTPRARAAT
jgi:CO/xanthine dehydrogenase Mo-binding subunit